MNRSSFRTAIASVRALVLAMLCATLYLPLLFSLGMPVSAQTGRATAPPTNTRRPTATIARTPVPSLTALPTLTPILRPTLIATSNPNNTDFDATWTPEPEPVTFYTEYFIFTRPIPYEYTNYLARNYAYGSRDGGGRPTHYGADFQNPAGTPVIAAASGVVEYAGEDVRVLFGPQPNFYGNVVVIRHNFTDVDGRAVFTLYGHLSRLQVGTGQAVQQGEVVGLVGSSGVAVGAHLHFEVRVGNPNDYGATRNPELWVQPFTATGVLAGRVMDTAGNKQYGVSISIKGGTNRDIETYWDDGVKSDTRLNENFVIGDLPAGYYQVIIRTLEGALKYRNTVFIRPGRVAFLEIYINP